MRGMESQHPRPFIAKESYKQIPRRGTALILSCGLLASLPALAADEPRFNQVSLRAEVSKEVARDLMVVTLYSEAQNSDPAKLANDITTSMNKALEKARAHTAARAIGLARGALEDSITYSQSRVQFNQPIEPLRPLGDNVMAAFFQPDGPGTRAWLLTGNYRAILEYNCSSYYALSVGLLADEIVN